MPVLHIVVLALIQGVTEFLPVSSSGHLALVPMLTDWSDQGLTIDVAVHVGTLGAVILYFWRDAWGMTKGMLMVFGGRVDAHAKLAGLLLLATIPVVVAGYGLHQMGMGDLRSLNVIAWATLGFGLLLWITDKAGMTVRRVEHLSVSDAVIIGIAQVLALIPGASRSGVTMSAARMLGMERTDAARFSMLLSIPVIIGAGALTGYDLYLSGDARLTADAMMAAGLAFVTALIAIGVLMAWLKRSSFTPFVIYRIILGVGLLGLSYGYVG